MKLSSILAFTAAPLVSLAAPILSAPAQEASAPQIARRQSSFSIGRQLTSFDVEKKCRQPDGTMDQSCAAKLWNKANDLQSQYQAMLDQHELDDVDDVEFSTIMAELEDPEMAKEDGAEPYTGEKPEVQRRSQFDHLPGAFAHMPKAFAGEEIKECGNWTARNNVSHPIPERVCNVLAAWLIFKIHEDEYEAQMAGYPTPPHPDLSEHAGKCGDWRDPSGDESYPIPEYVCGKLEQDLVEHNIDRDAPLPKLERRQYLDQPYHPDTSPGDCGNWTDVNGTSYPIPKPACELLITGIQTEEWLRDHDELSDEEIDARIGDCGIFYDQDGESFDIDRLTRELLEQDRQYRVDPEHNFDPWAILFDSLVVPEAGALDNPVGIERRQSLLRKREGSPEEQPGNCGNWTDHLGASRPIPKGICSFLTTSPFSKDLKDDEFGNCGEWDDADEESFPIDKITCQYLEEHTFGDPVDRVPWLAIPRPEVCDRLHGCLLSPSDAFPLPDSAPAVPKAEPEPEISRRQLLPPALLEPGDCGTWTDALLHLPHPIPRDFCDLLNAVPAAKKPEDDEVGDCGVWTDTEGETFPLDFYVCGMLERALVDRQQQQQQEPPPPFPGGVAASDIDWIPDHSVLEPRHHKKPKMETPADISLKDSPCTTYFNGIQEKGFRDPYGKCWLTGGWKGRY